MNQHFILTNSIPELNTPERIYSEWSHSCDSIKLMPNISLHAFFKEDPSLLSNFFNFYQNIMSRFNFIPSMLSPPTSDINYLLGFINQTSNLVSELVFLFRTLQYKEIVKKFKSQNNEKYGFLFNNLEKNGDMLLVELQRYKVHADFLAKPGNAVPKYWNILNDLNNQVIEILKCYLESLRSFLEFCGTVDSFQHLTKILLDLESDEQPVKNAPSTNHNNNPYQGNNNLYRINNNPYNNNNNPYNNNNNPYNNNNNPYNNNNNNPYNNNNNNPYNNNNNPYNNNNNSYNNNNNSYQNNNRNPYDC